MSFAASSSTTASQRDERVFNAAFGMMDSSQDGEAVAAFMRVREILHRHGGGFRRLLERSHEAERLNEELGRQNALLLRENAALRARDSRPVPPAAPVGAREMLSVPAMTSFRNWDIGLIIIVAVWAGFGLLGATTALSAIAAILVLAALTNWFSPVRFFAGALLALAAYGTVAPQPAAPSSPTYAVAVAKPPAKPPLQIYAGTAAPATPPAPAESALLRQPDTSALQSADLLHLRAVADSPRRVPAEPRTRQGTATRADCGTYGLRPGFNCPRGNQWHSYSDSERPPGTRSE
jgi:hypothetical protein